MGWLGRWLGAWAGRWLGHEPEQQQAPTVPYTRYGRILSPSTDRLFGYQQSSALCQVSSSAVILGRQETDDYVRFRVPDTNCPPLPGPSRPLDSGVADYVEPGRWQYSGQYVYPPYWRFSSTMGSALDWVQPSYGCYLGDFLTRVTASAGGSFQQPIYYVCDYFGLFVLLGNSVAGIGFGGFVRPAEGNTFAVNMVLWHSTAGRTAYNVWVNLGVPVYLFVRRTGSTISVGWSVTNPNAPDPTTEIEVAYGVSGLIQFRLAKQFDLPASDPPLPPARPISATVSQWRTIYGAPDSIWVETPVVDLGEPLKREVRGLPNGIQLVWRASNSPFGPADSSPSWSNPVGEYRYWQVRASTTSISTLIERIELGKYPSLEPVWLRNRFIWLMRTDKTPVVVPFKPVAWSHRVSSVVQTVGGYEVTFSDEANEYSLLLEER